MRACSFSLICLFSLLAIGRRRVIINWVVIELNLLLLLPSLVFTSGVLRGPRGLKLFFIQSLGGLLLLINLRQARWAERGLTQEFIAGLLLFKIGGFPFHQWTISLMGEVSWEAIAVLLTLQKILPLHLLAHRGTVSVFILSRVGWVFLRRARLLAGKTKKLMLISSVFFLAALTVVPVLSGGEWKKLLLIYFVIFFSFRALGGGEKDVLISSSCFSDRLRSALWLFVLLTLSGRPPFLGFFLKLEISALLCDNREIFGAALFLMGRAVFLYIYVSLMLHFISSSFGIKRTSGKRRAALIRRLIGRFGAATIFLF